MHRRLLLSGTLLFSSVVLYIAVKAWFRGITVRIWFRGITVRIFVDAIGFMWYTIIGEILFNSERPCRRELLCRVSFFFFIEYFLPFLFFGILK